MTRHDGYAYKHFKESVVHLFRECPEGSIIGIARRDSVNTTDPRAMKGLELCAWCEAREQG